MYKNVIKRLLDIVLSFCGLLVLVPIFLIVGVLIYIDDPGPVFFKQKRVGKNKEIFWLHKFRSMKLDTPDTPTHLLENPERYITKIGGVLRKTSIDELPQIYDILIGNMSIIGPRPALWNQDDLIAERDKYGANDVAPGLTGWAQINGRDELPIDIKARFEGEYIRDLNRGGAYAFWTDVKCFFGTIGKVLKSDGVVEGALEEKKESKKEVIYK